MFILVYRGEDLLIDFFKAAPILASLTFAIFILAKILLYHYAKTRPEAISAAANNPRISIVWGLIPVIVAIIALSWWLAKTDLLQRLLERSEHLRTFDPSAP